MKRIISIVMAFIAIICGTARGQNLSGAWTGELKVSPRQALKLVFHIGDDRRVTMDSPSQGAYGIECQVSCLTHDSVSVSIPSLMLNYAGCLKNGKIVGTFRQGGMALPLTLESGEKRANRPQTPAAPFPYLTEEVKISHGDAILSGILTIPENSTSKTPVAIFVTGSGLQNRDEELFEHKPFAVIADYLARNGIASLRYDDRGFGESTGDPSSATTQDFAEDALTVVDWVRSQKRFGKVGIIGHSEGGQIACILGGRKKRPDFIVSVAGPSIPGYKTIAYQNAQTLMKSGIPQDAANNFGSALEKAMFYKLNNPGEIENADSLIAEFYPQHRDDFINRQLATSLMTYLSQPAASNAWMDYFLRYDPAEDMKSMKVPALIIFGEKDRQVPPSLNEGPARMYSPKAQVKVYPGLNHLMQHASSGDIEEYNAIEETFAPEVLRDIASFIVSH